MSLELITGDSTQSANGDAGDFFAGTLSPRKYSFATEAGQSLSHRAETFLSEAFAGRKYAREIREAFSTSDFTLAAFALIDTEAMAQYAQLPSVWRQYTAVTSVMDFRPKRLLDRWYNQLGLKPVPELTEYPTAAGLGHATFWINVAKYGLRDHVSFEALINNEAINELEDIPTKFARAAAETEAINALSPLLNVDPKTNTANGFNTSFWKNYTSGDYSGVNNTKDTKAFNATNVDAVLQTMNQKVGKRGRLIYRPDLQIVVPKALEWQANKIKALQEIRLTNGTEQDIFGNYLQSVDIVVEPMWDTLDTSANAHTSWMVLPKPNSARPASFAAFLRGYENPELRVKDPGSNSLGGGAISPLAGSFEVDDIQWRIRHILGNQAGDPTFTYASDGSAGV